MSKFLVGECPGAGWQAGHGSWPLVDLQLPALEAAPLPRGMLHTQHGDSVQGQLWSRLQPHTATGMESLCAPTAAPAGPAALGDTVAFSLRQAGRSTGGMELLLLTPVPRGVPTQVSFEQGAARVLPSPTSQIGIIC